MAITKDEIAVKLITDTRWLERGILAIYNKQTYEEQASESTLKNNGVGFNGVDAYILSSFAKQLLAGNHLSKKQRILAAKKMPKYAGQLLQIVKEKYDGIR